MTSPAMTSPAVTLAGATLARGGRRVLGNLSLSLEQGEFVGLLGPNGAGKTTLLRALLGLIRPDAGQVMVLGAPARPGRPGIGYLPQHRSAAPLPLLTGWDFVASAAASGRLFPPWLTRAQRDDVARALDQAGATRFGTRPLAALSGGERQRLRLAQAVLGRPRLLLLDEPLVNLDPAAQAAIVALVRALQRDLGCTVLFSSHDLNPILPAIDRVLYLAAGRAAIGPPGQVVTGPVLSRLYGAPVEIIRAAGRILVLPADAPPDSCDGHAPIDHARRVPA